MSTAAGHPMAWADDAACVGMDTERFYVETPSPDEGVVETCARCPVRSDCLTWALSRERDGYWAGMTARARVRLRRSMGITLVEPTLDIAPTEDLAS